MSKKTIDPLTVVDWIGRLLVLAELFRLARGWLFSIPLYGRKLLNSSIVLVNLASWFLLPKAFYVVWTRKEKRVIFLYPLACCSFLLWSFLARLTRPTMSTYKKGLTPYGLAWDLLARRYWLCHPRSEYGRLFVLVFAMAFLGVLPRVMNFLGDRSKFFLNRAPPKASR